jgi:O-antigen ligase
MKQIATIVYLVGIYWLCVLDRDKDWKPSATLWIPFIWMWIVGSRAVSQWLAGIGLGTFSDFTADQYLDGSPLDRFIWITLLILGLIVLLSRSEQVGPILRGNGWIVLFFLYCGISCVWSEYPDVAFKRWIKGVGDVVMVLIVLTETNRLASIKRLLTRLAFTLIPLSVLLIKYYPEMGREYSKSWVTLYSGVTTQKNSLGLICLYFGFSCVWRFAQAYEDRLDPKRKNRMFANGAIIGMVLWLFYMCNAMTSFMSFMIGFAAIVVTRKSERFRNGALVHLAIFAVIGLSLFALFGDSSGSLVASVGRNPTLTGRTEIWEFVIKMAGNPLFGTGFETFWLGNRLTAGWTAFGWSLNEAHNGYLEVFLNLGWIGVILLGAIIMSGYRRIITTVRQDRDLGGLWLAFLLGALIYGLSEASFRELSISWELFLAAIMACAAIRQPVQFAVLGGRLAQRAPQTQIGFPVRETEGHA